MTRMDTEIGLPSLGMIKNLQALVAMQQHSCALPCIGHTMQTARSLADDDSS